MEINKEDTHRMQILVILYWIKPSIFFFLTFRQKYGKLKKIIKVEYKHLKRIDTRFHLSNSESMQARTR